MTKPTTLDHLAELAGLELSYWDIWGQHHQVADDNKRRILAAMGFAADTEAGVAQSVQEIEERSWRRALPAALVKREGEPFVIPLTLSSAAAKKPQRLEIVLETGEAHIVDIDPTALAPAATRTIGAAEMKRYEISDDHLPPLPFGYHAARLIGVNGAQSTLISAPKQCWLPTTLEGEGGVWGLSAQLYSLRRAGNWGIGDYTDLAETIEAARGLGAALVGVNPLHALFLDHPEKASPYSPASRLFLNPLYLDVEAIPEFALCPEAKSAVSARAIELTDCWAAPWVDYERVASLKMQALAMLYDRFAQVRRSGAAAERAAAFARFCDEGGEALRRFALFQALSEHFRGEPWRKWSKTYRKPDSAQVRAFAERNAARVEFFQYLQWCCDEQLAAAVRGGRAKLAIGLYRDLAIGGAQESGDAWGDQELLVPTAKVGCPPDPFNMLGQDWEIPPIHPLVLQDRAYKPFIDLLRANMRHAGALRIDHVMGLMHLFWIPGDGAPKDGAYVRYPFDDLLAILALESQRHRCVVVGEDLGTVPEGFRERMTREQVLSYRVLYFEKAGDGYAPPAAYPANALACVTTHDLATLWGYWRGADLEIKRQLSLYPSPEAAEEERAVRVHDRYLMLKALQEEGLLPRGRDPHNVDSAPMDGSLAAALHVYLARSPAKILLVQIDDLTEEEEQINLPGTVDERPNWRRKLSKPIDALPSLPTMRALKSAISARSS